MPSRLNTMKTQNAFTLLELLVTIAIIAVLAAILFAVSSAMRSAADQTYAANNFKQIGSGLTIYTGFNDGVFPHEGEEQPTWESCALPEDSEAWYNAIPRILNAKGAADFAGSPQAFYKEPSLLYVPAAKYPTDKEKRPLFPLSINSKLRGKGEESVRLGNVQQHSVTVAFLESGLPGEAVIKGQDPAKYDGQPKSFANRAVARYGGKVLVIFVDGHVEFIEAESIVDPSSGKAYSPQIGDHPGRVLWTGDPAANPNK